MTTYRQCVRCVMDTTDPDISFDKSGVCCHCRRYERQVSERLPLTDRERRLERTIDRIKRDAKGREYDCVLGLSGGVDSSYLAHEAISRGLRPLAIHVDTGWNSELAVKNVESLIKKLNVDLVTYVIDWEAMRGLQLAFLKSGVANQDVPQDHAIVASVLQAAADNNVRWVLSGANHATESILPNAWGYNARDLRHVRAIASQFGDVRLRRFPTAGFFKQYFYYPYIKGIRKLKLLNYIDYQKSDAMDVLKSEYGWRYYGGKHYESRFTKFFQGYFLPTKFGYDKRKAHLSSLIVSGQMTRDAALETLEVPAYPVGELEEDRAYVLKKLGLSKAKFQEILDGENRTHRDYASSEFLFQLKNRLKKKLKSRRQLAAPHPEHQPEQ